MRLRTVFTELQSAWLAVATALMIGASASAEVRVVATTPTLADIAGQVGGEHVEIESIMRGPENPHNVIAKPSYMMKIRKADLFVHTGLDAEPWVRPLLRGARKRRLLPGQPGNVDASRGIDLKEVPSAGQRTRALGDIHVYGNTHYIIDPLNGITVARTIADALQRTDPGNAQAYEANYDAFAEKTRALTERLVEKMKPYEGARVVVYHRTWPYFRDRFGLVRAGEIEPKPGITPGPQHLRETVQLMRAREIKVVIVETFNNKRNAEWVADRVDGAAVELPSEVNGVSEVATYQELFEYNVDQLIEAFQGVGMEQNEPGSGAD